MRYKETRRNLLNHSALTKFVGVSAMLGGLAAMAPQKAAAFNLYNGTEYGNNVQINLSTTVSWTPIWRVQSPSLRITSDPNANDGDYANAHGLISNLFEIAPILDIKDGDFGAHFSGEAYFNPTYLGTNDAGGRGAELNYLVAKDNDYPSASRNVNGENARVLDAFGYGSIHFGADQAQTLTVRVGRETLLWGQSLFFSNNGIAAGMAPIDIQTADNNPNAETQQIIEPTGQVEVTYQPTPIVTLQGYYKFEWERDYFPGAGSYFNSSDLIVPGGSRLLFVPGFGIPRQNDLTPSSNNGQFGMSLQLTLGNYDVGFYGLRYDSAAPALALSDTFSSYQLIYPRDIYIEGAAVSTNVGAANVAGEVSFRQHMNLAQGTVVEGPDNNANSNPAYPTGNTVAAQASAIYLTPSLPIDPGGITVDGEIAMNHLLSVTANKQSLAQANGGLHRSDTAAQFKFVVTPTYFNVLPNLQLALPVGLFYNFLGRSKIDSTENHGTGSVNAGIQLTYRVTWLASLTYSDQIGAANPALPGEPATADRSFVLLNLQHSF